MNKGGRKSTLFSVIAVVLAAPSASAYDFVKPLDFYGAVGYDYSSVASEGGGSAEGTRVLGSLNARGFLWQPWLATAEGGGTVSFNTNNAPAASSQVDLLSGHFGLNVLPRSRFPFRLNYLQSESVVDWVNPDKPLLVDLGQTYHSRFLGLRQRLISKGGNYMDGWFNQRIRGTNENGDLRDDAVGITLRTRGEHQNLYATGSYQTRERTVVNDKAENTTLSLSHNYFPSSEFYINTLANAMRVDNRVDQNNGSFFSNSVSDIGQVASHFYWRPNYRPFTMSGAARIHERKVDFDTTQSDQLSFSSNVAASYLVTNHVWVNGAVTFTTLDTDNDNSLGTTQSVSANYQSDSYLIRGFTYYWYLNGGLGNQVLAQYEDTEFSQNLNAGIGHSGQRRWITGNRSSLRLSVTQTARQFFGTGSGDNLLGLTQTGSLIWTDSGASSTAFAQLSVLDSRSFGGSGPEIQLATAQVSRTQTITRLSAWAVHFTLQTTHRVIDGFADEGFATTAAGRFSYSHARLFGVYRLRFLTKLDLTSAANRGGGDRRQADWENRIAYNVGLLNTALTYRMVQNESGDGSRLFLFQVYRVF